MKLSELQSLFFETLWQADVADQQTLVQQVEAARELTPEEGLAIYRGSVVGKLNRSLRSIYPVCDRIVGEKFFDATAVEFIRRFPSISPDLGNYGAQFANFLANFEPAASLPYLPDVAHLEWHWHRIFNGEDTPPFDFQALGQIPPENWEALIFALPKNSALLQSSYPIHRIWQVNQPEYDGEATVNLDEGGIRIFLWRKDYDMRLDFPTIEEWLVLKAFQAGERFGAICEQLCDRNPAIDVAALLPIFVQRGWVAGFSV